MLEAKAEVDARDAKGWAALHYATRGGHRSVALALVRAGAAVAETRGGNRLSELNAEVAAVVR